MTSDTPATTTPSTKFRRILFFGLAFVIVGGALFWAFCGFYTIQPIGAVPEGRTLIVWRASGEPFFNSPDAACLERMGGVSLMCRMIALGQAPTDRIVMRLPYVESAYLASTGGREFRSSTY